MGAPPKDKWNFTPRTEWVISQVKEAELCMRAEPEQKSKTKESDRIAAAKAVREIVDCLNEATKELKAVGITYHISVDDPDWGDQTVEIDMKHTPETRVY